MEVEVAVSAGASASLEVRDSLDSASHSDSSAGALLQDVTSAAVVPVAAPSPAASGGPQQQQESQEGDKLLLPPRAVDQPTPFGLNRFVLLVVYILYVAVSGRVLFGWPHLSNMLLHDGAYLWRCSGQPFAEGKRYACALQDSSVQLLFTLGIGISFSCSLAAGALLDWAGPRLTACVGQLCSTIGWVMLSLASESCQLYIPAVILMAMGGDAGYLPSMNVANLFPGYEQLVTVAVCAAMSASFSITSIMNAFWRAYPSLSFKTICLLYAGLGSGLCLLVAFLFMPRNQYSPQEELTLEFRRDVGAEERRSCTDEETERSDGIASNRKKGDSSASFSSQLRSDHFILIFIYWPLNALFYNFYMTSAENLFGKEINDFIGILGPVSMVPAVLGGFVADRFGVMALLLFISTSGVCMNAFALMPFKAAHYISPIFSCLYVSNFSGQMYAYVSDTFRSSDFGRIVGLISITGGLLGLLRIPLNDHLTLNTFGGNYRYTCAIMLAVAVFCLCIATRLLFIKRKQQKAYMSDEELREHRKIQTTGGEAEVELQPAAVNTPSWT